MNRASRDASGPLALDSVRRRGYNTSKQKRFISIGPLMDGRIAERNVLNETGRERTKT